MKNPLILLFCAIIGLSPTSLGARFSPTEPEIEAMHGRTVRVRVPAGFEKVALQQVMVSRAPARGRRWQTVATNYPRGASKTVRFQLSTHVGKRFLRVIGTKAAAPLPGSLLTGFTTFLPDPATDEAYLRETVPSYRDGVFYLSSTTGAVTDQANPSTGTPRTVAESDIWKVQGDRLYFYNELRGLQVFDVANPDAPALLGTLRMPGAGEEMYLLGDTHAVLLKQTSNWISYPIVLLDPIIFRPLPVVDGGLTLRSTARASGASSVSAEFARADPQAAAQWAQSLSVGSVDRISAIPRPTQSESSEIVIADVRSSSPTLVARLPIDGSVAESRLVGSVLYLATNVHRLATDTTPAESGVQLASYDLADPENPVLRGTIFLGGWANAVTATDRFFLVAKNAPGDNWQRDVIDLIDISAPDGAMTRAGTVPVDGNIPGKFYMNIAGDVLTTVASSSVASERFRPITRLETFSLADPVAPVRLGSVTMAPGETVRATRFDGDRAYVVTFRQIDPLHIVNLADPAHPTVSGEVEAPGFSTYIEPLGDRLVTVGLVNWQPAVSLFDVSDPAAPQLLTQLRLNDGESYAHSEAVWNEKAFKVLPQHGLVLLPVSGGRENGGWFSRVQLIDLRRDALVKRGAIEHEFSPRRATVVQDSIVAISPTRLVSVNADDRDKPVVKADLEIAWRVDRVFAVGEYLVQIGGSAEWNDTRPPTLRVSTSDEPGDILTTVDLRRGSVLGATTNDGLLYLAQRSDDDDTTDDAATLAVSAYNLTRLPALRLVGRATARTQVGFNDLTAHWPSAGVLVWESSGGSRSWWGPVWHDPTPLAVASGDGYWSSRWFYNNPAHFFAFDFTRPQAPKFLSDLRVGEDKPWRLSKAFDADGLLFLSYKFFGKVSAGETWNGVVEPLAESPEDDPDTARANRHFLARLDYADPSAPVIDNTRIGLPGELRGLARDGQLLFTAGQNYDATTGGVKPGAALHASAFDGTAAHLLDALPLASAHQPLVIRGQMIFTLDAQPEYLWTPYRYETHVGEPAALRLSADFIGSGIWWGGSSKPNDKLSQLSAWSLNEAGKFVKLAEIPTGHDTALAVFGELVVTQNGSRSLSLFDGSATGALESLGTFTFDGWVTPNLEHAAGGLETGLWVPLGQYGIEAVAR